MRPSKSFRRRLRQKERRYYARLDGHFRDRYSRYRNPKWSKEKNKKRIHRLCKVHDSALYFHIKFPSNFSIYSQSDSDDALRACCAISDSHRRILLDLSRVELISAAAAAMLMSCIYKALSKGTFIKCNHPADNKAVAVLQKIGLFSSLGKKSPLSTSVMNSYPDVECWYVYSENSFDAKTIYECVHDFAKHLKNRDESQEISASGIRKLEINVKELIANIVEHAYSKEYTFDKRWLLFARYDHEKHWLTIIISDSGKTIPTTFVQYHQDDPGFSGRIKSALNSDRRLIAMAVQEAGTGTQKGGRGYGLRKVEQYVQEFGGGLFIYSRNGFYKSDGSTAYIHPIKLRKPVEGTIVDLILPLESLLKA